MKYLFYLYCLVAPILLGACQRDAPVTPAALTAGCLAGTAELRIAAAGERVYGSTCQHCHGVDGRGQPGRVPALANNTALTRSPARGIALIQVTRTPAGRFHGMEVEDLVAELSGLDDQDVAAVMTYVTNAFGNCRGGLVTPADVQAVPSAGN